MTNDTNRPEPRDLDANLSTLSPIRRRDFDVKLSHFMATEQALEDTRKRVVELEAMVALHVLEKDTLEAHLAQARAEAQMANEAKTQALAQRATYEAVFRLVGDVMRDFVPPAPAVITADPPRAVSSALDWAALAHAVATPPQN